MKTKSRMLIIVGVGVFILSSVLIYWFYFSKPNSFPKSDQLIEEINDVFPEAEASVIQNTIHVDERHVYVPFISEDEDYGKSYWEWKKHKWKVLSIDTTGEPLVWKIDRKDPSTFHLVWNINPHDQLSYAEFFLIRKRGYLISGGREHYYPGVQMGKKVHLDEKSYGVLQLPNEWVTFMDSFIKVETAKHPDLFFPGQSMDFGWIPYDRLDKETFPKSSVNGSSFTTGDIYLDFIRTLDEDEIESNDSQRQ